MATNDVLNFLIEHNRPFSINDISQGIGKEHGKAAIQKALDKLIDKEQVFEKSYGKQTIYCLVQKDNKDDAQNNLQQMEQEINDLSSKLKSNEEELQSKVMEKKRLESKKTMEEALAERKALREEVVVLRDKVKKIQDNSQPISEEEKKKITTCHDKYLKEYRKRRRICLDILNAILENYPKTKKHLYEDIGIETDEDAGFKLE